MNPGKFDLVLYRGDSYAWRFRLWQDAAQTIPVDLTGATVKAEIRDKSGGAIIIALVCTTTPPNTVDVSMTPALYANSPAKGVWDLQITFPDTSVHTPITGTVTITGDVTDSIALPAARR